MHWELDTRQTLGVGSYLCRTYERPKSEPEPGVLLVPVFELLLEPVPVPLPLPNEDDPPVLLPNELFPEPLL
jgi:hypothetical protein